MIQFLEKLNYPIYIIEYIAVYGIIGYILFSILFKKFPQNYKLALLPIKIFVVIVVMGVIYFGISVLSGYHLKYCLPGKGISLCN
jgi:hypothetical protein